jgi:Do/DeqQ family serine protease
MKRILGIILIACLTTVATLAIAKQFFSNENLALAKNENHGYEMQNANYKAEAAAAPSPHGGYVNLETAAERSTKAVVHIRTKSKARAVQYSDPFGDVFGSFFGQRRQMQPQSSSGSGVIISADGYIVTNNHVVDGAEQVEVTFKNKRTVTAKVVGKDASFDLAVLKVEEKNLPTLSYGNSDNVKLGEWVLAVGYPLNLETTVTAGIVSAKHRNIGINQRNNNAGAIESFIQTDAAVNPGNSGGALVNAKGELIGINTAIASPTGSYAGYSYAIPANLVKKVVGDMVEYGNVQRAYLGVNFIDSKTASKEAREKYNLDNIQGVAVGAVIDGSGADRAGLKEGDIIKSINDKPINSGTQLQERIASKRPGEKVSLLLERNGRTMTKSVTLKNNLGNTEVVKKPSNSNIESLGATFRDLSAAEKRRFKSDGVMVSELQRGIMAYSRIKRGFIITSVNDKEVKNVDQLNNIFSSGAKTFQIGGFYPGSNGNYFYSFQMP